MRAGSSGNGVPHSRQRGQSETMTLQRYLPRLRAPYRPSADTPSPYAEVVRAGERIYLSAQGGAGQDGRIGAPGDAPAQTNAALDRLEMALAAAGASLANVTKLTTSIIDRSHR